MKYKRYHKHWNAISRRVKKQQDFICGECGRQCGYMETHHIDGNVNNNKRNNLVALCRNCHLEKHRKKINPKQLEYNNFRDELR